MFRPIRTFHLLRRYTSVCTHSPSTASDLRALPLSDAQRKTIYALSTPPAKSGVAVIRVSGPDALHVWQQMVRATQAAAYVNQDKHERSPKRTHKPIREGDRIDKITSRQLPPEAWKLQRCHVVDPQTSELLDDALAVFFRGASP